MTRKTIYMDMQTYSYEVPINTELPLSSESRHLPVSASGLQAVQLCHLPGRVWRPASPPTPAKAGPEEKWADEG